MTQGQCVQLPPTNVVGVGRSVILFTTFCSGGDHQKSELNLVEVVNGSLYLLLLVIGFDVNLDIQDKNCGV